MIYKKDGKILVSADGKLCSSCCSISCVVCWTESTIRFTFSDIQMCSGGWPGGENLNQIYDLSYFSSTDTYCIYRFVNANYYINLSIKKSNCLVRVMVKNSVGGEIGSDCYYCDRDTEQFWGDGGSNNSLDEDSCYFYDGLCDCDDVLSYGGSVTWEIL